MFDTTILEQAVLAVALLVVGALAALAARRAFVRVSLRRRFARAREAEESAAPLLRSHGYEIVGTQVRATYQVVVDGTIRSIALRADYVVARGGRMWVAEVKSGASAPNVESAPTRRQLLEYRVAYDVDGVLLVDVDEERVQQIVFPLARRVPGVTMGTAIAFAAFALLVGAVLAWNAK